MSKFKLPILPFEQDVETKVVLKKLALAHRALAELNGVAETIPNEVIVLNLNKRMMKITNKICSNELKYLIINLLRLSDFKDISENFKTNFRRINRKT